MNPPAAGGALAAASSDVAWQELVERLDGELARVARGGRCRVATRGVAGRELRFEASSELALERVVRPLAGLAPPAGGSPGLDVLVGQGPSPLLDAVWTRPEGDPRCAPTRPRWRFGDGVGRVGAAWPAAGLLGLLDRRLGAARIWLRDPRAVTTADAATLVRALVAWWLADGDWVVVHAAAVAGRRGAALLVGPGGTGKSSTAAAAFAAGLDLIGDDSVLCRASTAEVFSIGTSISLFGDDLARHHPGLARDAGAQPERDGKVAVAAGDLAPGRVRAGARLRALVVLRRDAGPTLRVRPAPASRLLAALAPSSVFNVPAAPQPTFAAVAALARAVPACELALDGDRDAAGAALRRFLDEESG